MSDAQDDSRSASSQSGERLWVSAITPSAAGWFGAALIGLALVCFLMVNMSSQLSSLGSAALSGTAILAIGLVALIVLSRAVGILDPSSALGLPPGSIRALLALGLAIVFVSVASWTLGGLFDPMGRLISEVRLSKTESSAYRDLYPANEYIIGETDVPPGSNASPGTAPTDVVVKVYLKKTVQDAGLLDLAKQIMTISATVLVTVVGFYFGSNSSSEAARTLQSTLAGLQGRATGPVTADDLIKITNEIAGIGTDVGKKIAALGPDPMAPLAAAVAGASADVKDKMSNLLTEAQQLFDSLKAAQHDVFANADRAKEMSAVVKPDARSGDLLQSRDQAVALRTGATEASRKFEQSLAAFTAARDAILQGTAKG